MPHRTPPADPSLSRITPAPHEQLADQLFRVSARFTDTLRTRLAGIPARVMALPPHLLPKSTSIGLEETYLPTPIVPILTPFPRPLAQHLYQRGFLARPITHPTVPKGEERVRICLHAANTEEEVDGLVDALVEWAKVGVQVQSQVQTMATAQSGTLSLPNAKL
ncbi:hypothetical protein FRC12_016072 [Ceratobasidium sp. 428]|nr:hypothetical protein FRC12_016072 [Ceratobasidium sp. 428]